MDVDKLGLQLSINGGITINKIYPSSFLYESGLVEVGDSILEIEVNEKYTKNVEDYIGNLTKSKDHAS